MPFIVAFIFYYLLIKLKYSKLAEIHTFHIGILTLFHILSLLTASNKAVYAANILGVLNLLILHKNFFFGEVKFNFSINIFLSLLFFIILLFFLVRLCGWTEAVLITTILIIFLIELGVDLIGLSKI